MSYYKLLKYVYEHNAVDDETLKNALGVSIESFGDLAQGSSLEYLFRYHENVDGKDIWHSELTSKGREALEQMKTTRFFGVLSCALATVAAVASIIGLFLR